MKSFSEINKSITEKVKKLNSIYKEMQDNRLFIFSPIYATEKMIDNELQNIIKIQSEKKRKFNIVYVCLLHELIVFNIKENSYKCIQMDKEVFDRLSEEANKEIKSQKYISVHDPSTSRPRKVAILYPNGIHLVVTWYTIGRPEIIAL